MAAVTVGDNVQKRRTLLLKKIGFLAVESVDDRERVVAVNSFGIHGVGLEAGSQAGREHIAHGLAPGLSTHGVLVVHHVEQDWQPALHVAFPECVELIH